MRNIEEYPINDRDAEEFLARHMREFIMLCESPEAPIGCLDGLVIDYIRERLFLLRELDY
jgi:hypothetical protein